MTPVIDHTLADIMRRFLRSEKAGSSPAQYAATSQALRLFSNLLREKYKLSPHTIPPGNLAIDWGRAYLHKLQESASIETEHLYSRALSRFYSFVTEQHIRDLDLDDLTRFITDNRRTKSHAIPDIPIEALAAIVSFAQTYVPPANIEPGSRTYLQQLRDKAYILTLHDTGLRLSEICGLRAHQVDPPRNLIRLETEWTPPISAHTSASLHSYLRARQTIWPSATDAPLFARHDKRASARLLPISRWTGANIVTFWVQQALPLALQNELQQKNQPITTNTFRHYFVYRHIVRDSTLANTQKLARHSDIGTTRRYLKTLPRPTSEQTQE